jgi:hypothetical protein
MEAAVSASVALVDSSVANLIRHVKYDTTTIAGR